MNRRNFVGLLLGLSALFGGRSKSASESVIGNPAPKLDIKPGFNILPPNHDVKYIEGHDFDVVTGFCRKCGMSEMEYYSTQKEYKQFNHKGELVAICYYDRLSCLKH